MSRDDTQEHTADTANLCLFVLVALLATAATALVLPIPWAPVMMLVAPALIGTIGAVLLMHLSARSIALAVAAGAWFPFAWFMLHHLDPSDMPTATTLLASLLWTVAFAVMAAVAAFACIGLARSLLIREP